MNYATRTDSFSWDFDVDSVWAYDCDGDFGEVYSMSRADRNDSMLDAIFDKGIDPRNRRLYLDEEIDEGTAAYIIKGVHMLERQGQGPIEVWINTPGGYVSDGLAIYDALRGSKCVIRTVATGEVCSMGTIVFLAGQERVMTPNCEFMVHPMSTIISGSMPDADIDYKRCKELEKKMLNIYTERTKKRRPYWAGINRDRWISPGDCVEFGIAHEILEYPEES